MSSTEFVSAEVTARNLSRKVLLSVNPFDKVSTTSNFNALFDLLPKSELHDDAAI